MSRATACFSMYSLMSKRRNSLPRCSASCLASSVLPTPVGPVKRKHPAGRSGCPSPARARLMARATVPTASSCPKTTRPSDSSSDRRRSRSEEDACLAGIRAIRATTSSMFAAVISIGSAVPPASGLIASDGPLFSALARSHSRSTPLAGPPTLSELRRAFAVASAEADFASRCRERFIRIFAPASSSTSIALSGSL